MTVPRWGRCALTLALTVSALGCAHRSAADHPPAETESQAARAGVAFYLEAEPGRNDALILPTLHSVDGAPVEVRLQPLPAVAPDQVASVAINTDEYGFVVLDLQLGQTGTQRLRQVTAGNIGKRIAVVADGRALTVATVMGEIGNGQVRISGLELAEAQTLQRRLTTATAPAR